jgi:CHASE3 domain sensor protein
VVGIGLYLTVWTFASWSLLQWGRDADEVSRANQTLTQIERLLSSLENAETAQRGYLLTGRQSYLAEYETGVRDTKQTLTSLRSNEDVFPSLHAHLDFIEEQLRIRLADMAQTIELRRLGDFEAVRKRVTAGRGKSMMDKIRHRGDTPRLL